MKTSKNNLFDYINIIFMIIMLFITLYPFWHQVVVSLEGSFSGVYEGGLKLWPKRFSVQAYRIIFQYQTLWLGFRNSVIRVIWGSALTVIGTAVTAYPLSKKDLPFKGFYTTFLFITMLFGGGLIPTYLLIRSLGLFNTYWSLVLPGMISAYNVFIVRNFFKGLPEEIEESAFIDGASWLTIFVRIVLPMSVPVLAVIALWSAVGHWNSWFDVMIYVQDPSKVTLPLVLRRVLIEDSEKAFQRLADIAAQKINIQGPTVEAAILVVSLIPLLIVYPFVQRYFVSGIRIGAIKG